MVETGGEKGQAGKTLVMDCDPDFFNDLSEYMDILGNPQRLRILKAIEREPKDIRRIADEIGTSYDNTKKHLSRLLGAGLVRKDAGFGQHTSRGMHPVWKFSLAPGAFLTIIRNLGIFTTISGAISDSLIARRLEDIRKDLAANLTGPTTALVLLSGSLDGEVFPLLAPKVTIGRSDTDTPPAPQSPDRLVLPFSYSAVTRISHPHAVMTRENDRWFIEDRRSTGGTTVNGAALGAGIPARLENGDVIELGRGPTSLLMTFITLTGENA